MKKLLALFLAAAVIFAAINLAPRAQAVDYTANLISCWSMDETSGTRADTVTASANNLTDNNSTPSATGIIGNAASFNAGTNSRYLSLASASNLPTGGGARTIAFWFYANAFLNDNNSAIFDILNGGSGQSFTFQHAKVSNTHFVFTDSANSGNNITISAPSTGAWHYSVLVLTDSTHFKYYLDGSDQTASTNLGGNLGVTINTHTTGLNIGRRSSAVSGYYDGLVDEVAVWTRAISASEVTSLYNSAAGTSCATIATVPSSSANGIRHRSLIDD